MIDHKTIHLSGNSPNLSSLHFAPPKTSKATSTLPVDRSDVNKRPCDALGKALSSWRHGQRTRFLVREPAHRFQNIPVCFTQASFNGHTIIALGVGLLESTVVVGPVSCPKRNAAVISFLFVNHSASPESNKRVSSLKHEITLPVRNPPRSRVDANSLPAVPASKTIKKG